jgi:hypothetical protein
MLIYIAHQIGSDVAHPGIANDFDDEGNATFFGFNSFYSFSSSFLDAKKYHTYYQWVCFVLFFQACACYTPKFIWDAFEGGK